MTPANPDALADAPYVLLKRGLFERPGHHGYTGVLRHAGRFSHEEASSSAVHGGSVTMMLASEAPVYSPACWHETQVEDLLDLLRIEREAKATAEARAAQLQAEVEALKEEHARYRASAEEMWETAKRHGGRMLAEKRRADMAVAFLATANAEIAQLRAEVEAKDRALKDERARRKAATQSLREKAAALCDEAAAYFDRTTGHYDRTQAAGGYRATASKIRLLTPDRTALAARAATAREGQADA